MILSRLCERGFVMFLFSDASELLESAIDAGCEEYCEDG